MLASEEAPSLKMLHRTKLSCAINAVDFEGLLWKVPSLQQHCVAGFVFAFEVLPLSSRTCPAKGKDEPPCDILATEVLR